MGDVILSEPVAFALSSCGLDVGLCTEHEHVGNMLATYSRVHAYSHFISGDLEAVYDRVQQLRYELRPGLHYLDAYAQDCDVTLQRRVPAFRTRFAPLRSGKYGLIAPDTSEWMREMRTWPPSNYERLARVLPRMTGYPWLILQPEHSFTEMLSLVANANLFVGNDSGPAILAQAFSVPCVVLFGATSPDKWFFGSAAIGITHPVGCNGCRHVTPPYAKIGCTTPHCITGIQMNDVLAAIQSLL